MRPNLDSLDRDVGDFAGRLRAISAVKIDTSTGGGFRMKIHEKHPDAPLSPIFLNIRTPDNPKPGPLKEKEVRQIGEFFYRYLRGHRVKFQGIAGIPRAGDPLAKALQAVIYHAEKVVVPVLTFDKIEEDGKRRIGALLHSQDLPRGSVVLLLDDLITKADSKLEALEAVRGAGYEVNDCLVFVDREQGGKAELASLPTPVQLRAVTTLRQLLSDLHARHRLKTVDLNAIMNYLEQNS